RRLHVEQVEARLPRDQRVPHLVRDGAGGLRGADGEDEVGEAAAEVRPHHALARARAEDDPHRLAHALLVLRERDVAVAVRLHGERPADAEELGAHPTSTVPTAITFPTGWSAGSLHVSAVSPMRAAALPLIFTFWLPTLIVALFFGGFWND